jgi:predicted nucleic acid-binding protein
MADISPADARLIERKLKATDRYGLASGGAEPVLLDTDTLSELSRGNATVATHAQTYSRAFGRFTISSVTVFERLRGYRQAIRAGKSVHRQLHAFEGLVHNSVVLPFDANAAAVSSTIWAACSRAQRQKLRTF